MNIKEFFLLFFAIFFIQIAYTQNGEGNNHRVTVEDTTRDGYNYMDHPDYPENRKRFLILDRAIDQEFANQSGYYSNNIYKQFSSNQYDLETLQRFIQQAQGFIVNLKTNANLNGMCAEYSKLIKLVRPGDRNQCEFLMDQQIKHVNEAIKTAHDRITAIKQKSADVGIEKTNTSKTSIKNNVSQNPNKSVPGNYGANKAELDYQAALERQRIYNESLQAVTDVIVSTGVEIVNQIQQGRIDNINFKNKQIGEYLQTMSTLDEECAQLFNEDYQSFLLKEKELRKYENRSLDNLNWLIDKTGESKYKNIKGAITDNQKTRFKKILKHNTTEILNNDNGFKDDIFIMEFQNQYVEEIRDFAGKLSNEYGQYSSDEGGYQIYLSWVHFIDEERKTRTQQVLELNKSKNLLKPFFEIGFYLFNNYYDPFYDNKATEFFSNSNMPARIELLTYAVLSRDIVGYSQKDDRHVRLLLGDGSEPIYYYGISTQNEKDIPLYKYLNHRDYGFKNTEANELVKAWIKRDEKASGKKAKTILEEYQELKKVENYVNSIRIEIEKHIKNKDYKRALSIVEKAREGQPDHFDLLIAHARVYQQEGNYTKALELLKEGISIKPKEPSLFFYIGVLEAGFGNKEEATVNYRKAITLKPDYFDAIYNLAIIEQEDGNTVKAIELFEKARVLDPKNYQLNVGLGEIYLEQANIKTREANENTHEKTKWKEIFIERFTYLKGALSCYKAAIELDDSDESLKEQIPLLQAKIDQANAFLTKK